MILFLLCQISKLKCSQCEFLSFKNIDQWKNHVIGHWRLAGMTTDFEVGKISNRLNHSNRLKRMDF